VFTGLIHQQGRVLTRGGTSIDIACADLRARLSTGASVAVNGVCLTVARLLDGGFSADLLPETLAGTTLGSLDPGEPVNLEQPLRAGEEFGGHFVMGHVDGTVRLMERVLSGVGNDRVGASREGDRPWPPEEAAGETWRYTFELPGWLAPWVIDKGSIALDGVSLTIQQLAADSFSVALIPETLKRTTLGDIQPGQAVNVEADMLVKAAVRAAQATFTRQGG
jgi:riboflavin synthase